MSRSGADLGRCSGVLIAKAGNLLRGPPLPTPNTRLCSADVMFCPYPIGSSLQDHRQRNALISPQIPTIAAGPQNSSQNLLVLGPNPKNFKVTEIESGHG